jgi:thymidylate synthase (FAD)
MNTAKIIAVTQPTIYDDNEQMTRRMNVDEFIAYVARVSNPSNQMNTETAPKLLRYLAKHKHWSPFEMVNVVMEIETTRDIARQILRHRSFSFQEFSQRYADPKLLGLGYVCREARLQDTTNRQNSIEVEDENLQQKWDLMQIDVRAKVEETYNWAIRAGIAKEQARAVLPEGMTVSRMYMNGTLRSWIHYIVIRSGEETQKEHREIAIQAKHEIVKLFPSLKDTLDI